MVSKCGRGRGQRSREERVIYITPMYGCYESLFPDRGNKRKNLSAMVDSNNP